MYNISILAKQNLTSFSVQSKLNLQNSNFSIRKIILEILKFSLILVLIFSGNGVHIVKVEQPGDDGTQGELVLGPGSGGMQPRQSEVKRALPTLAYTQEELLKKAKRYAMEQSVQQV
jgi:hypothetical protein